MYSTREVDVAVVGAGPAGLAAAIEARGAGARVLVLDEGEGPGGRVYGHLGGESSWSHSTTRLSARGSRLLREFQSLKVEIVPRSVVWGIFEGPTLEVYGPTESMSVRTRSVVLAPGAVERWIPFPGWTLPGVLGAGGMQAFVLKYGIVPGSKILLAGTGPLLLSVAAELLRNNIRVVAVLEASSFRRLAVLLPRVAHASPGAAADLVTWLCALCRARVPVRFGRSVVRAAGEGQIERATVVRLDSGWSPMAGTEEEIEVDTAALNYGFVPSVALAASAGCRLEAPPSHGVPAIFRDGSLQSSVPGVYVCGDGARVRGALVAEAEGRLAGIGAAAHAGCSASNSLKGRMNGLLSTLRKVRRLGDTAARAYHLPAGIFDLITPETEICRCEEVTAQEVWKAIDAGASTLKSLKGLTNCGMGPCQGQVCGSILQAMLIRRGVDRDVAVFTPRPPVRPVPLSAFVGV